MVYTQSKKITDQEKKLKVLKTQLYGKGGNLEAKLSSAPKVDQNYNHSTVNISPRTPTKSFLKKDLLKILFLATVAISVQLLLFFKFNY